MTEPKLGLGARFKILGSPVSGMNPKKLSWGGDDNFLGAFFFAKLPYITKTLILFYFYATISSNWPYFWEKRIKIAFLISSVEV